MKKLLSSILLAVAAMTSTAQEQTFTVGNYNFKRLDANTVAVAKGVGVSGDIVIPSSVAYENVNYTVTQILGYAFENSVITGVTIPASIDSIGERAFGSCASLAKIVISDSEKVLKMRNGYYGSFNYSDAEKSVYVGRDLWRNEDNTCFGNATSVVFGDNVTAVNSNLFNGHSKLATITIGSGVKTIGTNAFKNTGTDEGIAEQVVTLGGSVALIGSSAFESCSHLQTVALPATLTNIDGWAFSSTGLTAVTIPVSVDSIGERAFGSCAALAAIHIDDSKTPLKMRNGYYGSFAYCGAEKTVYVGRDLWRNEDNNCFENATSVVFGDNVTAVNSNLFNGHRKLATITIGSGVKTIGTNAFNSTGYDESIAEQVVTLGSNVTLIEGSAFEGCSHLTGITLPETLTNIDGWAFSSTGLTAVTIPASVDSLGERAFGSCAALAAIHIDDSKTPLKMRNGYYGTFAYSDAEKSVYVGRDILRNDANSTDFSNTTSVELGDEVTLVNSNMFNGHAKLAKIVIGSGVKTIGAYAFNSTGTDEGIAEQVVTMGGNVALIGSRAFESCSHLQTVALPATLKNVDGWAFSSTGLTAVTIPASVDSLGERAFGSCAALAAIHIDDSKTPLKMRNGYYGTFAYSDAEKSVYVGRDILRNDVNSTDFSNTTSVELGDEVTLVNSNMFNGHSKLSKVIIGSGVKTIGAYAFKSTGTDEGIAEQVVTMGGNVALIGSRAFESCSHLQTVALPQTLKNIDGYAFSGTGLTAVTIPASVDSIGDRAFGSCEALAAIRIPDGEKTLKIRSGYYGTFAYSTAQKTVYVGRNLWRNSNEAVFTDVTGVEFGPTMTNIAAYLLAGSTALTNVKAQWLQPFDIDDNVFAQSVYQSATLWIPSGTLQAYKAAKGWKNFLNVDYAYYRVSLQATGHGTITAGELTADNSSASALFDRESSLSVVVKADEGYQLASLTVNGTAVQPADGVYTIQSLQADQAIVATFAPITYTISYDLAGGTVADGSAVGEYTIETETFTLVNPVRDGYTFEGWTGTSLEQATKTVTIAKGTTGNRSYTATWKAVDYTISYDLAGGVLPAGQANPATYTIETEPFTLVNPERQGYTFEGWTGTSLEQATVTVTIARGSTGNRSYTATWKENAPEPGPEPTLAQGVLAVTPLPDMNTGRISHQIMPTDDGFAVFGGHVDGFDLTRTAERYSFATGKWTTMQMEYSHDFAGSIVMPDGKLLLMAGMSSGYGVGSSTNSELYDPATNTFTEVGSMVQPRSMCKAVMGKSGKVYVNGTWYNSSGALECYDPETQTFTTVGDGIITYKPLLFAMRDDRIVILGGTRSVIVENGTTTDIDNELLNSYTILKGWDETQMKDYQLADYSYVAVGKADGQAVLLNIVDDAADGLKVSKIADLPMTLPTDATAALDYVVEQTRVFAKPAENRVLVQTTAAADSKRPVIVEYTYPKADKLSGGSTMVYATKEPLEIPVNQGAWATLADGTIVSTGGGTDNFTAPANVYLYKLMGGVYCDVNGDGSVDVADIASIISVMAGSSEELRPTADVNIDGSVDVADIATVISRMAELSRRQKAME